MPACADVGQRLVVDEPSLTFCLAELHCWGLSL
jgi:hypothetical protein